MHLVDRHCAAIIRPASDPLDRRIPQQAHTHTSRESREYVLLNHFFNSCAACSIRWASRVLMAVTASCFFISKAGRRNGRAGIFTVPNSTKRQCQALREGAFFALLAVFLAVTHRHKKGLLLRT